MKQFSSNSTSMVGDYLTLKEARKAVVRIYKDSNPHNYGNYFYIEKVYQETDGTFSIQEPKTPKSKLIEGVDKKSGRRFDWMKVHGKWDWVPKKKIQDPTEGPHSWRYYQHN